MHRHLHKTEDVLNAVRAMKADLHTLGVRHVSVFGSVARGEAGINSDVDLALDIDPDALPGGFQFIIRIFAKPSRASNASQSLAADSRAPRCAKALPRIHYRGNVLS